MRNKRESSCYWGKPYRLAATFGDQFLELPTCSEELDDKVREGIGYLYNPERLKRHYMLGLGLAAIGMPVATMASLWIYVNTREERIRQHEIALFGQGTQLVSKARTMVKGAHHQVESVFGHTTFVAHRKLDGDDERLLKVKGIRTIRRMGMDDLFQTRLVREKKMDVTGVRWYSPEELAGMEILSHMTKDQYEQAGIGEELQFVYRHYPIVMALMRPRHAGISVRATLGNGPRDFWQLVHHGIRQWTDLLFVLNANKIVEQKMMKEFVRVRTVRGAVEGVRRVVEMK